MGTEFVSSHNPAFGLCLQARSLTGLVNQFVADVESEQVSDEVSKAAHDAYEAVKKVDLLLAEQAQAKALALSHYSRVAVESARESVGGAA
jgi:hypothetical protein